MQLEPKDETETVALPVPHSSSVETTPTDFSELLESLRELDRSCGPSASKHERAIVMIHACIDASVHRRSLIVALLQRLGFKRGHIMIVLNSECGNNPSRHRWQRDELGVYTNLI